MAMISTTVTPDIATVDNSKGEHLNWMGGRSWDITDPILQLQVAAASSFFGEPQYYHDPTAPKRKAVTGPKPYGRPLTPALVQHLRDTLAETDPQTWRDLTPQDRMVSAIRSALDHDPEATLALAAELRQTHHIRTTPQAIMVEAAIHPKQKGTGLVGKYAPKIIGRIDEVCTQYAYYLSLDKGHTPPKSLKRAWAKAIAKATPYQLAKYRMEGRMVNLYDVINICHAKGPHINDLMVGKLKLGTKAAGQTWESIRSAGGSWDDAAKVMGHMALLKNLRNLGEAGKVDKAILDKLKAGAAKGKQLPFRYVNAFKAVEHLKQPQMLDAIEDCLEQSMGNLPRLEGRVMSLSDNSGSAWGTMTSSMGTTHIATIGNLMGILTAKCADEGHLGVFGDRLTTMAVRKRASVFDTLKQAEKKAEKKAERVGQATEHGIWLFWKQAIEQAQHWDMVFVYSDMQAGHGGLYGTSYDYKVGGQNCLWPGGRYIDVPMLINLYRKKVNPKVHVVLVQTAGYQDTLVPEQYDRTYILGGWSDQIIKYAAQMRQLRDGQVQKAA